METNIINWFENNSLGNYIALKEKTFYRFFFDRCNNSIIDSSKELDISNNEFLVKFYGLTYQQNKIIDLKTSKVPDNFLDIISLPHLFEVDNMPIKRLYDSFKILKPGGYVILTGFNKQSFFGVENILSVVFSKNKLGIKKVSELKEIFNSIGYRIELGEFLVYVPLIKNITSSTLKKINFLEFVGNRWWPHKSAIYGLVLKKANCSCNK